MANTFLFELVSPERLLVSEQVRSVVVPGSEGEFEVMKAHAPFLTTLRPGVLRVTTEAGGQQRIFVRGGFADVNAGGLTVLAEEAVPVESLRPDQIAQAIKDAEEDIADAKESAKKAEAERHLSHLREVQAALAA
jgi:F-type H+-transporting ATPase subunit epsilon